MIYYLQIYLIVGVIYSLISYGTNAYFKLSHKHITFNDKPFSFKWFRGMIIVVFVYPLLIVVTHMVMMENEQRYKECMKKEVIK